MGDVGDAGDSETCKTLIDKVSCAGERSQRVAAVCIHYEKSTDCLIHKVTQVRVSVDVLYVMHGCALRISPVTTYSGVKRGTFLHPE